MLNWISNFFKQKELVKEDCIEHTISSSIYDTNGSLTVYVDGKIVETLYIDQELLKSPAATPEDIIENLRNRYPFITFIDRSKNLRCLDFVPDPGYYPGWSVPIIKKSYIEFDNSNSMWSRGTLKVHVNGKIVEVISLDEHSENNDGFLGLDDLEDELKEKYSITSDLVYTNVKDWR